MKIIVDAFGGDDAPDEVIKGCRAASDEFGYDIVLVGDEEKLKRRAEELKISLNKISIKDAKEVISVDEAPTEIMKSKNGCSMAVGLRTLSEGGGDAFVSAGNSGALAVGATMIVKRIKGIKRCAFAPVIPKSEGFFMLIDSGANTECRPEMLKQFGTLGSVYMEKVMGVKKPRVGLLNVGTEPCKGDELRKEAYALLSESGLNFIGNIEARSVPEDAADVVVTDGFTGNVFLKLYEGVASAIFGKFKGVLSKNLKNKLAASLILGDLKELKSQTDYNEYGGAPLMGISKPVFKVHGSARATTFKNALRLTGRYVEGNVAETVERGLN